jgi:hypothetical protein
LETQVWVMLLAVGAIVDIGPMFIVGVLVRSRPTLVSRVGSSFTLRLGEDGIGVLGPDAWFAALVPAVDEAADGVDDSRTESKLPADGLAGDDPEEDSTRFSQTPRSGEVQGDPRVAASWALTVGCLWVA